MDTEHEEGRPRRHESCHSPMPAFRSKRPRVPLKVPILGFLFKSFYIGPFNQLLQVRVSVGFIVLGRRVPSQGADWVLYAVKGAL